MKKLITVQVALFTLISSFSQSGDLIINSGPKGAYLIHSVAAKEGLFPLGRKYNVHPRHIANFNGIDFNKGLSIGQQIRIPLSDTNFKQTVNKGVPVYYKVSEKESLANISAKTKAQQGNLRGWNNLSADNVSSGTKLIVGFLITNELQDRVVTITPKTLVVEESVSNVKKQESSEKKQPATEVKSGVVVEESVSNVKKQEESKKQLEPEIKKEEPKKTEPVVVKQPETIKDDGSGYFKK